MPPPPVTSVPSAATVPAVPPAEAECAVWAREATFAKAVFVDGDGSYIRGREAVVASWRPIIAGQKVRLVWHPAAVALTGNGTTAISRGPYVLESLRPDAKQRFSKGAFQSIWVRDDDGVWRVAVDGGTAAPVPATDEEARKLEAEMRVQCPNK